MEPRTVISFRVAGRPGGEGRGFLERARALRAKALGAGAVLVAFDATKVTFSLDDPALEKSLALVKAARDDTAAEEVSWSIGVAEGALDPLSEGAAGLAWGPALVASSLLASAARPGEMLCAQTVRALRSGLLLTNGSRLGREGSIRLRGARIDPERPWRKRANAELARLRTSPLAGPRTPDVAIAPGAVSILRADPGAGGTRLLTEMLARTPRSLLVSPAGSGFEPLGALRRALARSISRELSPLLMELADHVEHLLSGEGVSLDVAARLIAAFLWPKSSQSAGAATGALLIDDAKQVDPSTLEACVRAAKSASSFGLVARLDATGSPPGALATLPRASELEIGRLTTEAAELVASGCTSDALDPVAKKRFARLGGGAPLGVVEAVAWGIASGEIVFDGDRAALRAKSSGRGKIRPPAEWIKLRAAGEHDAARTVLCLVALLGGEAKIGRLARILAAAGQRVDVEATVAELSQSRWVADTEEAFIALPSRTHKEALGTILEADARKLLHRAAADVIDDEEGLFGRVEGAWHAAQSGDAKRAARTFLAAARATADAGLESSTTQLIAYARRTDPAVEEQALELLANALSRTHSVVPQQGSSAPPQVANVRIVPPPPPGVPKPPSVPPPLPPRRPSSPIAAAPTVAAPPPPLVDADETAEDLPAIDEPDSMLERALIVTPEGVTTGGVAGGRPSSPPEIAVHDSEPPTMMKENLAPMAPLRENGTTMPSDAPPSKSGATIATRLGELAKEALLAGDNAALERWVDNLRASGESPIFTERMRAMARIVRGDIGDGLRVLRRMRAQLDPKDHAVRCQTSLAMGIALSVAGRPQEALLEGMDALARARQIGDQNGAAACIAFLAKLFTSVGRAEDAAKLRSAGRLPA